MLNFVEANILSAPVFFRPQFDANILLALKFKDDYFLNILLMIVFCKYHDNY